MNEDEPKWLELWHENTTRFIRFSDALIITKKHFGAAGSADKTTHGADDGTKDICL